MGEGDPAVARVRHLRQSKGMLGGAASPLVHARSPVSLHVHLGVDHLPRVLDRVPGDMTEPDQLAPFHWL